MTVTMGKDMQVQVSAETAEPARRFVLTGLVSAGRAADALLRLGDALKGYGRSMNALQFRGAVLKPWNEPLGRTRYRTWTTRDAQRLARRRTSRR